MSDLNEIDPMNILLAVDVPESAVAGSTFHVELKNRFFEVRFSTSSNVEELILYLVFLLK